MHNDIPAPMQTFINEMYLIITGKIAGKGIPVWFNEDTGICNNWYTYCDYHRSGNLTCAEGKAWLDVEFNGKAYPFDLDNAILYIRDKRRGTLYDNPCRREFIARHYKESQHAE